MDNNLKNSIMNEEYVSPVVEVIEVEVEKGFASSLNSSFTVNGWGQPGTTINGDATLQ